MRTEVIAGQYLDVLTQATGDTSLRAGHHGRPVQVGQVHGRAAAAARRRARRRARRVRAAYSAYGLPLGEAFQLRDDVLGVFGDPALTGKPAGDDLREGKRTYLVAAALEATRRRGPRAAASRLGDPELDEPGVARLREIITATGALDRTEQRIATLTDAALAALAAVDLDTEARQALVDLAIAATRRAD